MDKFSEVDKLPKVDKAAHAGSSKVPENVREVPENESTIPLKDIADDLPPVIAGAPEVTYTKPVETTAEQPRKKLGLGGKVGIGVAGLFLAGGAAFGLSQVVNANTTPEDNPKDTTEVTEEPGPAISETPVVLETEAPDEGESSDIEVFGLPTVAELQVDSNLPDEEIARGFLQTLSAWNMAGANEEMFNLSNDDKFLQYGLSEYASIVANTAKQPFIEAIYGEYANSSPTIQDRIVETVTFHTELLNINYQTYGDQNEEPFMQGSEFISLDDVIENSDGTVTYTISALATNNGDKNLVEADGKDIPVVMELVVDKSKETAHLTTPPVNK